MRRHLRAVDGPDGLATKEVEALAVENDRSERRDHLVGIVGAVMVIAFVIGSWALLFAAISALIGASGAMTVSAIVSGGCALAVGTLYPLLKRLVEDGEPLAAPEVITVEVEVPYELPRVASRR